MPKIFIIQLLLLIIQMYCINTENKAKKDT